MQHNLICFYNKKKSSTNPDEKRVFLMNNIEGGNRELLTTFGRTFKMDTHITSFFSNVVQASFFDLYDDVRRFTFSCLQNIRKK